MICYFLSFTIPSIVKVLQFGFLSSPPLPHSFCYNFKFISLDNLFYFDYLLYYRANPTEDSSTVLTSLSARRTNFLRAKYARVEEIWFGILASWTL